jgi:hypothetical protein
MLPHDVSCAKTSIAQSSGNTEGKTVNVVTKKEQTWFTQDLDLHKIGGKKRRKL